MNDINLQEGFAEVIALEADGENDCVGASVGSDLELDGLDRTEVERLDEGTGEREDEPEERAGVGDVLGTEVGLSETGEVAGGVVDGGSLSESGDGEDKVLIWEQAPGASPSKNANVSEFSPPPP